MILGSSWITRGVRDHVRIQMALEPALGDVVSELGTYRLYILPNKGSVMDPVLKPTPPGERVRNSE